MTRLRAGLTAWLVAGSMFAGAAPALANSAAVDYFRSKADRSTVPSLLSKDERDYYSAVFAAIDRKDWPRVQAMLAERPDGPLHAAARAEYYLAAGSPRIEAPELTDLLQRGRHLPQAEQIAGLAMKRGALETPSLPIARPFVSLPLAVVSASALAR